MSVLHLDGSVVTRDVDGVSADMAATTAEAVGVCIRPLLRTVTDRATGSTVAVPIACGSTRASTCPSCADKARRLRMHQCREGWHLTADPLPPAIDPKDTDGDMDGDMDIVYRTMLSDYTASKVTGPGGQRGNDSDSSAAGSQPHTGTSDKPLPGPASTKPTTTLPRAS